MESIAVDDTDTDMMIMDTAEVMEKDTGTATTDMVTAAGTDMMITDMGIISTEYSSEVHNRPCMYLPEFFRQKVYRGRHLCRQLSG